MTQKILQLLAQLALAYLTQALFARTGLPMYATLAAHDGHSLKIDDDSILYTHHLFCNRVTSQQQQQYSVAMLAQDCHKTCCLCRPWLIVVNVSSSFRLSRNEAMAHQGDPDWKYIAPAPAVYAVLAPAVDPAPAPAVYAVPAPCR